MISIFFLQKLHISKIWHSNLTHRSRRNIMSNETIWEAFPQYLFVGCLAALIYQPIVDLCISNNACKMPCQWFKSVQTIEVPTGSPNLSFFPSFFFFFYKTLPAGCCVINYVTFGRSLSWNITANVLQQLWVSLHDWCLIHNHQCVMINDILHTWNSLPAVGLKIS